MAEEVVLRFDEVTFEYVDKKPVLKEASFSIRKGAKFTLMGQNGAGKSTIFNLIKGDLKPKSGNISVAQGASIGTARQTISRENLDLSIEDYFAKSFEIKPANLLSRASKALEAVNLDIPYDRKVGNLSGGQQARLLLAEALIVEPDILLLDEPTNNLDKEGIDHLIAFLITYDKTVLVISHDADFLNCFTEGVIYLDVFSQQTEMYVGDYYSVVEEITKRVEREQMKNAQLQKQIIDRKEKVNFFAHKGGKMRKLAQKMKEETEELEANMVDVRREDKTIRKFEIPVQDGLSGNVVEIRSMKIIKNHEPITKEIEKDITKKMHVIISGPNGIGKSTFLRNLVSEKPEGLKIADDVRIGYYSQDFSNLDLEQTVFDSLKSAAFDNETEQDIRSLAAGFLLSGSLMVQKIGALSEGQKGLLAFARLVLMKPGLLVLDEPTNHINFRHLPVIAEAINNFEGPILMVSHMDEFVSSLKLDDEINLGKY
ncbi:ABC-F family ATP-binding cassette domain-containing protein [Patescibacteria group bacterium]|nr:ABC-F family ATP-binding cassette domain-containing protein [Patescibacteria group bacterium]